MLSLPSDENVSLGQSQQNELPVPLAYEPASQGVHDVDLLAPLYLPVAHKIHDAIPASEEYVPGPHVIHGPPAGPEEP